MVKEWSFPLQNDQSFQTCIWKSIFNKKMYKNIGTDTAGVGLWEMVAWPSQTGQLFVIWGPFRQPCRRKQQLDFGTFWCFYLQDNIRVISMLIIAT